MRCILEILPGLLLVWPLASGCKGPRDAAPALEAAAAGAAAAAPATRLPAAARVVAIGDLHGDLGATLRVLRQAGIIDSEGAWAGGESVVVQTGDVLDRGGDEAEILELFERLEVEAEKAGGRFVAINGNHEMLNVAGDLHYASPDGLADFASYAPDDPAAARGAGRLAAFSPGGPVALRLARRNIVVVVGDTVFVHGGLLAEHVEHGLERLNSEVRAWMRAESAAPPLLIRRRDSPLWMRDYSDAPDAGDCAQLERALAAIPAARMVVGHTVQAQGIISACSGKVWLIDTGMTATFGGPIQALEIRAAGELRVLAEPPAGAAPPAR